MHQKQRDMSKDEKVFSLSYDTPFSCLYTAKLMKLLKNLIYQGHRKEYIVCPVPHLGSVHA